jgi:hypothetical protein
VTYAVGEPAEAKLTGPTVTVPTTPLKVGGNAGRSSALLCTDLTQQEINEATTPSLLWKKTTKPGINHGLVRIYTEERETAGDDRLALYHTEASKAAPYKLS